MNEINKHSKVISTLCYIRDNGKMLMLYRNKTDAHFNGRSYRGLGGKVEQGESPIECVKREVKEEAGIDIQPIWRGLVTFSNPLKNDWEAHVFTSEGFSGSLIDSPEGNLEWIDESNILSIDLPEGDKKFMPLLFEKDKFHVHLKYGDNKNLIYSKIDII